MPDNDGKEPEHADLPTLASVARNDDFLGERDDRPSAAQEQWPDTHVQNLQASHDNNDENKLNSGDDSLNADIPISDSTARGSTDDTHADLKTQEHKEGKEQDSQDTNVDGTDAAGSARGSGGSDYYQDHKDVDENGDPIVDIPTLGSAARKSVDIISLDAVTVHGQHEVEMAQLTTQGVEGSLAAPSTEEEDEDVSGEFKEAKFEQASEEEFVDIDEVTSGMSAMMAAAAAGKTALVEWLTDGADVNVDVADDAGFNALIHAVRHSQLECAQYLYSRGSYLEHRDKESRTPFMHAVMCNSFECAKWLVEMKANVETLDSDLETAFMIACRMGKWDMCVWLIDEVQCEMDHLNKDGMNAFLLAVLQKKYRIAKLLFEKGIDVTATDEDGRSAVHIAVLCGENKDAISSLVDCGVDINLQDSRGYSALMCAAEGGDLERCQILVHDFEADTELATPIGRTALMLATVSGQARIVEWLILPRSDGGGGADLMAEDMDGRNALMIATNTDQWAVLEVLDRDAYQDEEDGGEEKGKPLANWNQVMKDAGKSNTSVIEFLQREMRMDELFRVDKRGRTFLHHVALNGKLAQVRSLVIQGNVDILHMQLDGEEAGLTAFHLAKERRYLDVYAFLLVQLFVHMEARPPALILIDHEEVLSFFDTSNLEVLIGFCHEELKTNDRPILLALRFVWLLTAIGDMFFQLKSELEEPIEEFTEYACEMLRDIPNNELAAWVVEEPNCHGHCIVDIAIASGNTALLAQTRMQRISKSWWDRELLPEATTSTPMEFMMLPNTRQFIERVGLLWFVGQFSIFVMRAKAVDAPLDIPEILLYCTGIGQFFLNMSVLKQIGWTQYAADTWNWLDLIVGNGFLILFLVRTVFFSDIIYVADTAVVSVCVWIRALRIFQTHDQVGPLLLAIGKMVSDIKSFSLLVSFAFLGFMLALKAALGDASTCDVEGVLPEDCGRGSFDDITSLFLSFYRVGFAADPDWDGLDYLDSDREKVAKIVLTSFFFVSVIVLLNLLIAMMGETYGAIVEEAESLYKHMMVEYRRNMDQSAYKLPPPINLIGLICSFVGSCSHFIRGQHRHGEMHCRYCGHEWDDEPFNLNKPASGRIHRFQVNTLLEFPAIEAGRRICAKCLRIKCLVSEQDLMVDRIQAGIALGIFLPMFWFAHVVLNGAISRVTKFLRSRLNASYPAPTGHRQIHDVDEMYDNNWEGTGIHIPHKGARQAELSKYRFFKKLQEERLEEEEDEEEQNEEVVNNGKDNNAIEENVAQVAAKSKSRRQRRKARKNSLE